jgi:hypothetical protein
MSESGKANLRCVEHAAINEGSLVSQFLGRFAMLLVVASVLVPAGAELDVIAGRSVPKDVMGFLWLELLIVLAFAPVALGAAVLWIRDGIQKLTKTRLLNLEYVSSIGSMADDLFDRFRGGEESGPRRRFFARFLALTIATGVFMSVVYLPGIVAFAIYLLVKGEGPWAAVRVLAIGAAAILAMSIVPWLVWACLLPCAPVLSKLWHKLYPPNTTRSGSSPDEPVR